MAACKNHGLSLESVSDFASACSFPASRWREIKLAMTRQSDGVWKGDASDLLTVLPIFAAFAALVTADVLPAETRSLIQCVHMVRLYLRLTKQVLPGDALRRLAAKLQDAVRCHLDAFVAAHGESCVIPKHHYIHHISAQAVRDGCIFDAFSLERTASCARRVFSMFGINPCRACFCTPAHMLRGNTRCSKSKLGDWLRMPASNDLSSPGACTSCCTSERRRVRMVLFARRAWTLTWPCPIICAAGLFQYMLVCVLMKHALVCSNI